VNGYVMSPQARQNILDIMSSMAADDLEAAHRLRDRLFEAFNRLDTGRSAFIWLFIAREKTVCRLCAFSAHVTLSPPFVLT
jgi:hypothetical protein